MDITGDQGAVIEVGATPVRCYGSPWLPFFAAWAFNLTDEAQLAEKWDSINAGLDILVLHGPPHGILDLTADGEHVGSVSLRSRIARVRPKVSVFGHVHHSYGHAENLRGFEGLQFFNAAYVNEHYRPGLQPIQSLEL